MKESAKVKKQSEKKLEKETTTLQKYANATVTFYECGGHFKAQQNQTRMSLFEKQLTKEGVKIPHLDEVLKTGIFNGTGAY